MLLNSFFLILFAVIMIPAVFVLLGMSRWQKQIVAFRQRLEQQRRSITPRTYDPEETADLPAPVRQYFSAVLVPGQPLIIAAELGQEGQINLGRSETRWARLRATQSVVTQVPGFLWDARTRLAPGVTSFIQQGLLKEGGLLQVALVGLVPLASASTGKALRQAQRLRFLAESVWYPTRLLPSQGVEWEAIDASSARATLLDGETRTSLIFQFDPNGLILGVRADARPRLLGDAFVETAWEGRFHEYRQHGGMMIPVQLESAWIDQGQRIPEWEGRITEIMYKFVP